MNDDPDKTLLHIAQHSSSSSERRSALVKLRDIRSPDLRPILLDLIRRERQNQNLRETAIKALGEVGLVADLPLLHEIASGNEPDPARFAQDAAKKAHGRLSARLGSAQSSIHRTSLRSPISKRVRYEVLNRDHHRCVSCGSGASDGAMLEVDHILPVSLGGGNDVDNLQVLCDDCNQGKSNRHARDLRAGT